MQELLLILECQKIAHTSYKSFPPFIDKLLVPWLRCMLGHSEFFRWVCRDPAPSPQLTYTASPTLTTDLHHTCMLERPGLGCAEVASEALRITKCILQYFEGGKDSTGTQHSLRAIAIAGKASSAAWA